MKKEGKEKFKKVMEVCEMKSMHLTFIGMLPKNAE